MGAPVAAFAYGAIFWGYGKGSFGVDDEGWFGSDTKHGGGDKTGHFVSASIGTAAFAAVHRHWGFGRKEAALRGAIMSFATLAAIEVADGSSTRYGFSTSDLIADGLGAVAGYIHETNPWVNRVIDLRWEWFPWNEVATNTDLTSDYENSAYLLAVNVGGVLSRSPKTLDLVDLQLGYRTRGYTGDAHGGERWVFAGVGLNVANLMRRLGLPYAAVFDYFQLPFVSLRVGFEVGDGDTAFLWHP